MHTHVRLYVVDGKVLCPHGCEWKDTVECAQCADLERLSSPARPSPAAPDIAEPRA